LVRNRRGPSGEGGALEQYVNDRPYAASSFLSVAIAEIVDMDVSHRALEISKYRLHYERMPSMQKERLRLMHGSLIYRDQRLAGFDAAAVVEVIEHLDPPRLAAFERVLFECARPATIVVTTPNREYNLKWETLPAGKFRHRDHRFEWTRAEFQEWANRVAANAGYKTRFLPIGPEDPTVGSPMSPSGRKWWNSGGLKFQPGVWHFLPKVHKTPSSFFLFFASLPRRPGSARKRG